MFVFKRNNITKKSLIKFLILLCRQIYLIVIFFDSIESKYFEKRQNCYHSNIILYSYTSIKTIDVSLSNKHRCDVEDVLVRRF